MDKILTLQDLAQFCKKHKMYSFSSKQSKKPIVVRAFSEIAEFTNENETNDGFLHCTLKVAHTKENRNGSYISETNMSKALPSLKYRPILG